MNRINPVVMQMFHEVVRASGRIYSLSLMLGTNNSTRWKTTREEKAEAGSLSALRSFALCVFPATKDRGTSFSY